MSSRACALPAYPALSLVQIDSPVAGVKGTIHHVGSASEAVSVAPGAAEILKLALPPNCARHANITIAFARGLPLWVPINAPVCIPLQQFALAPGSAAPASSERAIVDAYYGWSIADICAASLESIKGTFPAPAHADALRLEMPATPELNLLPSGSTAVNRLRTAFDPEGGIMASVHRFATSSYTVLCSDEHTVPYGIAYAKLDGVTSVRGIALGMTPEEVTHIDGVTPLHQLGGNLSLLEYYWKTKASSDNAPHWFAVLFNQGRAVGMMSQ